MSKSLTIEQLNDYMKQLCIVSQKINESKAFIDIERKKLDKSKAKYEAVKDELEKFVEGNRQQILGNAKSFKNEWGKLGFKKSNSVGLQPDQTEESIIEEIKKRFPVNWTQYVRQKETLNKTAVKSLSNKQIQSLGLKCGDKVFWVTPMI